MSHIHRGTSCPYIFIADGNAVYHSHDTIHALSLSIDGKKVKMKVFTFWQLVFARRSSLQACWAFRINLRILHIYFPNRIHNSKVSFNFSRQVHFFFVVFPLQDIHIRKIIWLVKRSVTSHGNSPKWNPACPSTSEFYPPMKFLYLLKVCARIYILHVSIFFEVWSALITAKIIRC